MRLKAGIGIFIALSLVLLAIVVASIYHKNLELQIIQVYQFDWTVEFTKDHLHANAGKWPNEWDDLEPSFNKLTASGACPWTLAEIGKNVSIGFSKEDGHFVFGKGVSNQYATQRNNELKQVALDEEKRVVLLNGK
jgi:hypothetical protein